MRFDESKQVKQKRSKLGSFVLGGSIIPLGRMIQHFLLFLTFWQFLLFVDPNKNHLLPYDLCLGHSIPTTPNSVVNNFNNCPQIYLFWKVVSNQIMFRWFEVNCYKFLVSDLFPNLFAQSLDRLIQIQNDLFSFFSPLVNVLRNEKTHRNYICLFSFYSNTLL